MSDEHGLGNGDRRRYEQAERTRRDRWEAKVEADVETCIHNGELIKEEIATLRTTLASLTVELAVLKTKVALWAALGSVAGGAFVSFVIQQLGG